MGKNGGKRPGAGRPKGSKNLRRFQDYWTEEEVKTFIEAGKDRYMDSDKIYIEFLQQIFGKALQRIAGEDGGPVQVEVNTVLSRAYGQTDGGTSGEVP